ncbi:MAG: hypothetical protein ABIK09_18985 [Pseudomonadota bacterium]
MEIAIAAVLAALSFVPVPQIIGLVDHLTQLPATLKLLHPELYSGDLMIVYGNQDQLSLYTEALALAARAWTLEGALLIVAFSCRFLMSWGMLRLGRVLSGSLRWSILPAAAALVIPFFSHGGNTEIFEFLYPRTVVASLLPPLLAYILSTERPRWFSVGAVLGLAFIIHPLTAVPVLGVFAVALIWRVLALKTRRSLRDIAWVAAGYVLVSLPLWWRVVSSISDSAGGLVASSFSEEWYAVVAREENQYMFPGSWSLVRWTIPLAGLLLMGRFLVERSNAPAHLSWRRWMLSGVATVVALLSVTVLVLAVSPVPLILQLQFGRSLYLVPMLALPLTAWFLRRAEDRGGPVALGAAFFLALGIGSQHFLWLWSGQGPWIAIGANVLFAASLILDHWQARRTPRTGGGAPRWTLPALVALGLLLPRLTDTMDTLGESPVFLPRGVHVLVMGGAAAAVAWILGQVARRWPGRAWLGPTVAAGVASLCFVGTFAREYHELSRVEGLVGITELATFAREHTAVDAVFAFEESVRPDGAPFPPDQHFRLHGRRSVWLAHGDHVPGIFFPSLAHEWVRRKDQLDALAALPPDDPSWAGRLRGLGIDYYVARRQLFALPFVGVFDGRRAVYAVPRP